jgi:hypothetical protein
MVEVFRCADRIVAQRICSVVLNELQPFIRSRDIVSFPTPAANSGNEFIAAETGQAQTARRLLSEAISDGVIDESDGELLEQ